MMRSDREIREAVEQELRLDRRIDPTDVAVAVKDGVVMLAGFVRSHRQKLSAENDAKRVTDVLGVANDVQVFVPIVSMQPDPKIAREAVSTLQHALQYSSERLKVVVEGRWITLEGLLEWTYQRQRAALALHNLKHVRGVTNRAGIRSRFPAAEIKAMVEEALKRAEGTGVCAALDGTDGRATTSLGNVRSWAERGSASRA